MKRITIQKLPWDAKLIAIGTALIVVLVFFTQWHSLLGLVKAVALIALAAAIVLLPCMWMLNKSGNWASPRKTKAQRIAYPLILGVTLLGLIALALLAMAFFGGSVL